MTVRYGECFESFIQDFVILNWTTNMACGKFWDCVTVTFERYVQNSYDGVFCECTGLYIQVKSSNTEFKNHHTSRNKITDNNYLDSRISFDFCLYTHFFGFNVIVFDKNIIKCHHFTK